ncbi:TIGR00730 family Rossman fold protein [Sulfurovum riftiae]|uniref:Cytokinin riboside 5'-monophosphate phosphoribohydrolase n=1 Tax=Sulfurovum riftiae TaxID=1630136 RepID=A0A151CIL7_9BACT|nr:TIGR00730 family Rossman fold protein [Sulfurovum riftiae]KYJ87284.1 cytochrome D ubiquinol oxidase subunit II [Sulfurovum riftiae]
MKKNMKKLKKNNHVIEHRYTKEDEKFLYSDDARGIRLQLDYLKAETKMKEYGVNHTIVVFGSARVIGFSNALEKLEKIKKKFESDPDSNTLLAELRSAERIVEKSRYYEEARTFGKLVGSSGKSPEDCHVTLMTGGGPGIMEAANKGAFEVGAKSIGLNIELPHEQEPNPYLTPELSFHFRYFAIRKLHFMQRAKALVVFPGGFGTLDELFDLLTLIQTGKSPAIPVILICESFWNRIVDFSYLYEEGVISKEDLKLFKFAETAEEAWDTILKWYKKKKTPLF